MSPIHVVTIMNYDDPHGVDMCRIWFYLMHRFNPNARVTVFHAGQVSKIAPFGTRFKNVEFVQLDMSGVISKQASKGYGAHSQELIFAMWRHLDRAPGFEKHLYVEADAWTLHPLDDLWALADTKPYLSFEELIWKDGKPLINTGVHAYASRDGFVSYSILEEQFRLDGGEILIPVGEQGLINSYFRRIGYDCRHPEAGFEWNCWPANCITERADDFEIKIISGDHAPDRFFSDHPWSWYGRRKQAKILHSFLVKFWDLPECKQLWDYCLGKVNSM